MIRSLQYILSLIIIIQFAACQQKQAWKSPTKIGILMNLQPQGSGGPGDLTFTQGQITLSKISVGGKIEQANDFRFERTFPSGLVVDFNSATILQDLQFDIPQGEYSELIINFETKLTSKTIDIEGLFNYNNPNKPDAIIKFEVDIPHAFSIAVTNPQGNSTFSITDNNTNDIEVLLNPPYWFKNITASMMNSANTTVINSQPHIIINQLSNNSIYQNAKARIGGDATSTMN